jgi:hypothetical protein
MGDFFPGVNILTFNELITHGRPPLDEVIELFYHGTPIKIKFDKLKGTQIECGHVSLSKTGKELAPISGSKPVEGFLEYVINKWAGGGLTIYSDWPQRAVTLVKNS